MGWIHIKLCIRIDYFLHFPFARLVYEPFVVGKVGKEAQKGIPKDVEVYGIVGLEFGDPEDVGEFVIPTDMDFVFLFRISIHDLLALDEFLVHELKEVGVIEMLEDSFGRVAAITIFSEGEQELWKLVIEVFRVLQVFFGFSFCFDKVVDVGKVFDGAMCDLWWGDGFRQRRQGTVEHLERVGNEKWAVVDGGPYFFNIIS